MKNRMRRNKAQSVYPDSGTIVRCGKAEVTAQHLSKYDLVSDGTSKHRKVRTIAADAVEVKIMQSEKESKTKEHKLERQPAVNKKASNNAKPKKSR